MAIVGGKLSNIWEDDYAPPPFTVLNPCSIQMPLLLYDAFVLGNGGAHECGMRLSGKTLKRCSE